MRLMAPGDMNIRRTGRSKSQRMKFGVPIVWGGDYLAQRPVAGHGPRVVFHRQPWEAGPFIRVPAEPLPAAMGDSLLDTVTGVVGGVQSDFEQGVAETAVDTAMDRLRPYLLWGTVGVIAMAGLTYFVGYEMGRSAR